MSDASTQTDDDIGDALRQQLTLDVWHASGRDVQLLVPFATEHGWPLTWSLLLAEIRSAPRCWLPIGEGDWCVLSADHGGVCYGAGDVAAPVVLPPPANAPLSRATPLSLDAMALESAQAQIGELRSLATRMLSALSWCSGYLNDDAGLPPDMQATLAEAQRLLSE